MSAMALIPPLDLMAIASGSPTVESFVAIGQEFLDYFIRLAQLRPDARVLELGCGCGRMARPLIDYLQGERSYYEGIDVDANAIRWCQEHITSQFPRFRFQYADVYSSTYHHRGTIPSERYRLPFRSGTFDFVFLTSVFTHMLPAGMANYLDEVARVLRVGGTCLITFFLLNEESSELVRAGKSQFHFPYRYQTCCVQDAIRPECVVAHPEREVVAHFEKRGLRLGHPVQYGSWCGRPTSVSFQDMVIATKVRHRRFAPLVQRTVRHLFAAEPRQPAFTVDGPSPTSVR